MSWGRGWEVGVRKQIDAQRRAMEIAAEILATEHGTVHEAGARPDLCPKCQQSSVGAPQGDTP